MFHKTKRKRQSILAAMAMVAAVSSTGCRSGMPKMNMFGMSKEPSAETLAGSGPSVTYPAPPSSAASPEAIASVAGGTAIPDSPQINLGTPGRTQPGAVGIPSYGTAPQVASRGAAQANGFGGSLASSSSGSYPVPGSTSSGTVPPSTYAVAPAKLADRSAIGSNDPGGFKTPPSMAGGGSPNSASAPSGGAFALPETVAAAPTVAPTTSPSPGAPASTSTNSQAVASFALPGVSSGSQSSDGQASTGSTSNAAFATASNPGAPGSPASTLGPSAGQIQKASGYMPGSTNGSTGYPSSGYPGSGSVYR